MSIEELKVLQNKVIAIKKKYNTIGLIVGSIIVMISIGLMLLKFKNEGSPVEIIDIVGLIIFEVVFLIVIVTGIFHFRVGNDIKTFNINIKNTLVKNSLTSIFTNVTYLPESGLDKEIIRNTYMMNMGDRYRSNDFITGNYKTINFTQADVHIEKEEQRKDSDGHYETYYVTTFLGRWMIFDFNKEFKSNIQITNKYFRNSSLSIFSGFHKVKVESVEFNNNFRIYAQDDHDVFYILTPGFMEKITNISNELNCGLMFCFINNRLHIAIDNYKDSFEFNIFKPIDEKEIINNIYKDIKLITDFVDELDLDNNLFKTINK